MDEIVQEPAREPVEGHDAEIAPPARGDPEPCAVVPEEILAQRDVVLLGGLFVVGGALVGLLGAVLHVQVEPRVSGPGEGLHGGRLGFLIRHLARDDDAVRLGEEDAVDVVVALGRVRLLADARHGLGDAGGSVVGGVDEAARGHELELKESGDTQGANGAGGGAEQVGVGGGGWLGGGGDDLAIGQDHLDAADRFVKEAVAKGARLASGAGEAAAGRDAGELHDDGRDEVVAQGSLDEAVHGHVGLDQGAARGRIHRQDVAQGRDVDGATARLGRRGPRAVGRAVEDAVGLASGEEGAHGG